MTTLRRPVGRPRDPVSRDALLGAAIRVFARDGFGAATLAAIAREVGITKGALAYHFSTKEQLYFAVLAEIVDGFGAFVGAALTGVGTWSERLDGLGAAVVRVLGAQPDVARLMLRELTDGGPYLAAAGAAELERLLGAISAFLAEGAADVDPRQLAGTIVALHVGWFGAHGLSARLVDGTPTDPAEIERRVEAVTLQVRRLCGVAGNGVSEHR
ncbi:MAG: TetR/AcrR family transcriptional regulator [Myxococcota bacterium]